MMLSFCSSPLSNLWCRHKQRIPRRHNPRPRSHVVCALKLPSLIVGVNEYSHDTSLTILDGDSGEILFALAKERLTRRKHDGGDISTLVPHALSALADQYSTNIDDVASRIQYVIANNHHFRIRPFEARLPFQVGQGYIPASYMSPWNLIGSDVPFLRHRIAKNSKKVELSHHLAHAYSSVYAVPFDSGLIVIMDGMGDAFDDWLKGLDMNDNNYYTEESLPDEICQDSDGFQQFPSDFKMKPGVSFREAETVYTFKRDPKNRANIRFQRVFKRWTPENAPPELMNHSFEEMDSIGAIYSRVSALIFGDWNNCGKVMGLAPWANSRRDHSTKTEHRYFIEGQLCDGTLDTNMAHQRGLDFIGRKYDDVEEQPELQGFFEDLAYEIQNDLESIVVHFVEQLLEETGEKNLIFAGGVALNSTLNGILTSLDSIHQLYIPPYPGDEGISVGCAMFGYSVLMNRANEGKRFSSSFMPYFGKLYSHNEIESAITSFDSWIQYERGESVIKAAEALSSSKVIAWFNGRSELGARALGNRSILADPRDKKTLDFINRTVKRREAFRPFAPSVLANKVGEEFVECHETSSPFMSLTKKAYNPHRIKAVTHVDGSSRLQTVKEEQNPDYYRLISHFYRLTGIPMVLNTSFNVAGEPIVESPKDAIRSFLGTEGIDQLIFPGFVVYKKSLELHESCFISSSCSYFRSQQIQDSFGSSLKVRIDYLPNECNIEQNIPEAEASKEFSAELMDSFQLELLEFIQSQPTSQIADLYEEFLDNAESNDFSLDSTEMPTRKDINHRLADLFQKMLIAVKKESPELQESSYLSSSLSYD